VSGLTPPQMAVKILDELHDSSLGDRVYDWINTVQETMDAMAYWHHLESNPPTMLNIRGPYQTGTVDVTQGSAVVTGTGTAWDSTMVGMPFSCASGTTNSNATYYYISSVDSATQLTLAATYIGDSDTGQTYSIDFVSYDLPGDLSAQKIKSLLIQNPHRELRYVDTKERNELFPNLLSGRSQPRAWMSFGPSQIQLWPVPDGSYLGVLRYQRRPTDVSAASTSFDWPIQMHRTIQMGAVAQGWKWKDDNLSAPVEQEFVAMMQAHVAENNRRAPDVPVMRPFDEQRYTDRLGLIYGRRILG
jgi:hypothetical protein